MKTLFEILIVCLLLCSCSSADDVRSNEFCLVDNPVTDLPWLKAEIEEREKNVTVLSKYEYIIQSTNNQQAIIIFGNCNPLANSVFQVYNCEGENIGLIGDENFTFEDISSGKIIWKTDDFACEF